MLRLCIGWHFFKEGAKKLNDPQFSSSSFLLQAKGPLAEFFKGKVADRDGAERLNQEQIEQRWDHYRNQAADHYGFDDRQRKKAEAIFKTRKKQLAWYFDQNREDIDVYFKEVARLAAAKHDEQTSQSKLGGLRESRVPFQKSWIDDKERELRGTAAPWLNALSQLDQDFQLELYNLATPEQRAGGVFAMENPAKMPIDTVVTYLTFSVGVLLILGLFTRVAALGGVGFLAMVIATQPPWIADAAPTYNQFVELAALLVLAAVGAGRYAGLDFFIPSFCCRCCGRSTQSPQTQETNA